MDPRLKPRKLQQHYIRRTLPATWIVLTRTMLAQARRTMDCRNEPHLRTDMIGRIHLNIFFQDRYMLNEVIVKVRLMGNNDSFCLMSVEVNPTYKVKLIIAVVLVCKVQLSPSVFLAHAKALEYGLAKYPIKRVVCKTYIIPADNLDGNHEKLFTGQLPSRHVIGCVDKDYPNCYAPYAFDLSPDLADEGHFNLAKQGTVRVELKFGIALANTVTVVAYAEFENVIEVDRNRNIVYDFDS